MIAVMSTQKVPKKCQKSANLDTRKVGIRLKSAIFLEKVPSLDFCGENVLQNEDYGV
jgi:hypothetical protein